MIEIPDPHPDSYMQDVCLDYRPIPNDFSVNLSGTVARHRARADHRSKGSPDRNWESSPAQQESP